MILSDLMSRNPISVTQDVTLEDAARLMAREDIGFLPVVDGTQDDPTRTPLGVVTDRDLTIRGMAEGKDPRACTIGEVFTRSTVYAYDDTTAREALDIMHRNNVGRLLVASRNENLVGVVTLPAVAAHADENIWDGTTDQPEKVPVAHQHERA